MNSPRTSAGFTLTELLTVMSIVCVMLALSAPAIVALKSLNDFSRSVDQISGTLQQARGYAMAHNTYVWVGFYEENTTESNPTASVPPYTGTGRVILCSVASKGGPNLEEVDPGEEMPITMAEAIPLTKLIRLDNVHLEDVGAGDAISSDRLGGRPQDPLNDEAARISSGSVQKTSSPIEFGGYKFYKTIRFSPAGVASINGLPDVKRLCEIGLKPTRGTSVSTTNHAAIQFSGISGNVRIYRQ